MESLGTKKMTRRVWTKSDTRLLLACYKNRIDEFTARNKRLAYARVLQDMIDLGCEETNLQPKHLEGRIKTLLTNYKSAEDSARKSGIPFKAPYMVQLQEIFFSKTSKQKQAKKDTFKEIVRLPGVEVLQKPLIYKCRLCLTKCTECKLLFDKTGWANNIYSTTIKYFDPMQLRLTQDFPDQPIAMCLHCWNRISEFDKFKYSVLMKQTSLHQTKEKLDESKTLEKYFGKQQGHDPLADNETVENEAAANEDEPYESQKNEYSMDEEEDNQEDATNSNNEYYNHSPVNDEGDEVYEDDDSLHNYNKSYATLEQMDEVQHKISPTEKKQTQLHKDDENALKSIPNSRKVDAKSVTLSSSDEQDSSFRDDNDDMEFDEYDDLISDPPDDTSNDFNNVLSITRLPKTKFLCNICGISCTSLEALTKHECRSDKANFSSLKIAVLKLEKNKTSIEICEIY